MSADGFELVSILGPLEEGKKLQIEGITVGPLGEEELLFLDVLIRCADAGNDARQTLTALLEETSRKTKDEDAAGPEAFSSGTVVQKGSWKLGALRAENFRGLSPAGEVFEHDFEGRTTLIFGRNGAGKSCLLGAIAWALTGHFSFDDPEVDREGPREVETFVRRESKVQRTSRDPLLALGAGPNEDYWVEVELASDSDCLQIRRHNSGRVTVKGRDGEVRAENLVGVGLSASDLDIPLLMPRRLRNMTFKKSDMLWETLSVLLGHDRALNVGRLAGDVARLARRNATTDEKALHKDLAEACKTLEGVVEDISPYAEETEQIATWIPGKAEELEKKHVQAALNFTKQKYEDLKSSLAEQLGQESLTGDQIKDLPGRIRSVIEQLEAGPESLFSKTKELIDACSTIDLDSYLKAFADALEELNERIPELYSEWKEVRDEREELLRLAGKLYDTEKGVCPVCEQDVKGKEIEQRLLIYKEKERVTNEVVRKKAQEGERSLGEALPSAATWQHDCPATTLAHDWQAMCNKAGPTITPLLAAGQTAVDRLEKDLELVQLPEHLHLQTKGFETDFTDLLEPLFAVVDKMRLALATVSRIDDVGEQVRSELQSMAAPSVEGEFPEESVGKPLQSVRQAAIDTEKLQRSTEEAEDLLKELEGLEKKRVHVSELRELAEKIEPLKEIGKLVEAHTTSVLAGLSEDVSSIFSRLCEQDGFSSRALYRGDPANPNKGDTVRAFLSYGELVVEARHFGNEGLIRALAASTAISLLVSARSCVRFALMDDVVLSLDDSYRQRFAQAVHERLGDDYQLVVATHQMAFFDKLTQAFSALEDVAILQLLAWSDEKGITVEPGYFLDKGKKYLAQGKIYETAINFRQGIEGMLDALQSVLLSHFRDPHDVPKSLDSLDLMRAEVSPHLVGNFVKKLRGHCWKTIVAACHREGASRIDPAELRVVLPMLEEAERAFRSEYKRLAGIRAKSPLFRQAVFDNQKRMAHRDRWSAIAPVGALESDLVYRAAASDMGDGLSLQFESMEAETLTVRAERAVKCLSNAMDPVAKTGQLLLLGSRSFVDRDLVACRTQDGEHYLGRVSRANGILAIAPVNPVRPRETVCVPETAVERIHPVLGILYESSAVQVKCQVKAGWEWGCVPGDATKLPGDIVAIEVVGSCMEPVARHSQWAILRECALSSLTDGDLCIVERDEGELYFKRFYRSKGGRITLISVNPVMPEAPVLMSASDVSRAFRVIGAIFEAEQAEDTAGYGS